LRQLVFKKVFLVPFFLLLLATGLCALFFLVSRPERGDFVRLSKKRIQDLDFTIGDRGSLCTALEGDLAYLERTGKRDVIFQNKWFKVHNDGLVSCITRFKQALSSGTDERSLVRLVLRDFLILKVKTPVLVTGYYLPELPASRTRSSSYNTPVYGIPRDLVTVRLKNFPVIHSDKVLRGRIQGRELVPYYTRKELEGESRLPVLAYLESPVDLLLLQVQGSGILLFPDGSRTYVHYAADNGRPYRSVGRILIEKGLLGIEDADWPGIKHWFKVHPGEAEKIIQENPRYVFFKEDKGIDGTVGAIGIPLTALRSIAVDPDALPQGGLYLLEVDLPTRGRFFSFVVAQDVGSAIKGIDHIDLFLGKGEAAGDLAERLKEKGRLYLLLPKRGKRKTPAGKLMDGGGYLGRLSWRWFLRCQQG